MKHIFFDVSIDNAFVLCYSTPIDRGALDNQYPLCKLLRSGVARVKGIGAEVDSGVNYAGKVK